MHKQVEGIYRNGKVELLQQPLVLSAQVLNEFYVALRSHKRKIPLSHDDAVAALRWLKPSARIVAIGYDTTFLALAAVSQHGLSFWDALIWAAAKENGVGLI